MSVGTRSADVETLHRLGYAQELRRRMSTFSTLGWIAVIWIAFIAILFVLPQAAPGNTLTTFSYAAVAVAVVLVYAGGYWFLSAKNWFKEPKVQGTPEELAKSEAELAAAG